uniref:Uncharacterized protein n=1 Tax=Clytia hemisphaerica TaxID=252671 RepID=A0A7M5WXA6_9CNID|eukprot:TCONS_00048078-protein
MATKKKDSELVTGNTFMNKPTRVFTKEEKFTWGVDTFFKDQKTSKGTEIWRESPFHSYEEWYAEISSLLRDKKQENIVLNGETKYVFIKKKFNECHDTLGFVIEKEVSKETLKLFPNKTQKEKEHEIWVKGLIERATHDANFLLLHPNQSDAHMQLRESAKRDLKYDWFFVPEVTDDFYFGDKKSAIVLVILNTT